LSITGGVPRNVSCFGVDHMVHPAIKAGVLVQTTS
jgi:hypothetical protein